MPSRLTRSFSFSSGSNTCLVARSVTNSSAQNRPRPRMSPTWRWLPNRSVSAALQPRAHGADVVQQVVVADDALHLQRGGAGDGMRLVGVAVHEAAGTGVQRLDDPAVDQDAADRLVAAAEALGDDLDVRRDAFLLPGVHRAGAAHAAHHLVQDQQRAVAVADLPHALEIAGQRGDAAGGGADDGFGEEGDHGVGAEALELGLQFVGEAIDVLLRRSRRRA